MERKSVLYFMGAWSVGGVERVTAVVGNELVRRGWKVSIFAFHVENPMLLDVLDKRIRFVAPEAGVMTGASLAALRSVLEQENVGFIINDWSLPFKTSLFLRKAAKGLGIKQIVNLHNTPDNNARIASARNLPMRLAAKAVSALNMFLTYLFADLYVLLSPSFIRIFKRFACVPFARKVIAIGNPLTLMLPDENSATAKENILLFAGRLEERQKRFSRVAAIWRRIAARHPDWRLEVVGDGPDRAQYEKTLVGAERVGFEGFMPPEDFYRRAKILVMTSDFEGFPLVLTEAMAFGCVPVVLGSFAAAQDIIDGSCGTIVPLPYSDDRFAAEIERLMNDADALQTASEAARSAARRFSVETIADVWEQALHAYCR